MVLNYTKKLKIRRRTRKIIAIVTYDIPNEALLLRMTRNIIANLRSYFTKSEERKSSSEKADSVSLFWE